MGKKNKKGYGHIDETFAVNITGKDLEKILTDLKHMDADRKLTVKEVLQTMPKPEEFRPSIPGDPAHGKHSASDKLKQVSEQNLRELYWVLLILTGGLFIFGLILLIITIKG